MTLHCKQYVSEYYKYINDLFMKQEIGLLLEADLIQEQIVSDSGTILKQLVHMIHESLMTYHEEQHTSKEIVTQQQQTDEITAARSKEEARHFNIEEYNVDKQNKVLLEPLMNMTNSSITIVDQKHHLTILALVDKERIAVAKKK
ncbi:unnamed protein product [Didymodactylos carnosus]|uniref:Uncharacterized protein n=1 Tax=Didymodactylos carnosus TaxID=1234261 RepID=A0A815P514_9BILA|nr:unnamed protein product [Didymodactylos carnosus]CAF4319458.1 unnamed protein product [Didymodactylos carnosus]